jgi:hypothetical protein
LFKQRAYQVVLKYNQVTLHDQQIVNIFAPDTVIQFMQSSLPILLPEDHFDDFYCSIKIDVTLDQTYYDRSDYTSLQFLGDIGAVYSALYVILGACLAYGFRIPLLMDNHLLNGVFKLKTNQPMKPKKLTMNYFKSVTSCCCKSKYYRT